MEELIVVKIGGNIVDNPALLTSFLKDFTAVKGKKILVHGGGKVATKVAADLGIPTQMVEGRRVTDAASIKVVTAVYAGFINKSMVSQLQALGNRAWGVSGVDGALIPAQKRPVKSIDYGYVGDVLPQEVAVDGFDLLLQAGYSVVVAPITSSATGELLNTNADTIAQCVAVALSKRYCVQLIYVLEKKGVLRDIDNPDSVIKKIDYQSYQQLKAESVIFEGMLPKIENAFHAIQQGVDSVRIGDGINRNGTIIA